MNQSMTRDRAEILAERLAVLGEPNRIMLLRHLRRGDAYSSYLAEATGISPSLCSHHLSSLVQVGLVRKRRRGSYICFSADRDALAHLHEETGLLTGALMPDEAFESISPCDG